MMHVLFVGTVILVVILTHWYFIQYGEDVQPRRLQGKEHHGKKDRKKGRMKRLKRAFLRPANYNASFDRANTMPVPLNSDSIFMFQALRFVESAQQLVYFNGPRGKQMFDLQNPRPHLLLNRRLGIGTWDQLVSKISTYFNLSGTPLNTSGAVHIHNEEKIGDILLSIIEMYKRKHKLKYPRPESSLNVDRESIQQIVNTSPVRLAFTNSMDENWGFLSSIVGTRTTRWINMTNHLRIHYSDYHTLKSFLDSDKVILSFLLFFFFSSCSTFSFLLILFRFWWLLLTRTLILKSDSMRRY